MIFLYLIFKSFYFLLISDPLFASSLLKHAREANASQTVQFEVGENTDASMDISAIYAPNPKLKEKRSHEETGIPETAVNSITYLASPNGA